MEPEVIAAVILFAALTVYALCAGADFGAGVWEVNTALQPSAKERALLFAAIGPVWEANHVWLIFALVALFGAFPVAFAALSRALWLPLGLALLGIVFRGVGFVLRSYDPRPVQKIVAWEAVFALGSTAAPFFLGACVGAVASGQLKITADGGFEGNYLTGWLSPLSLFAGFFVVGVCAYLSAVYLTREASHAGDAELVELWRRRAMATGIWMGVLAVAGVAYVATDAPLLWDGFRQRSWPLVGLSLVSGFLSLYALAARRYRVAMLGAVTTVATVIWGWGVAQYPLLVPPAISLEDAKAPANVLWLLIATIGVGSLLLVPALLYLFYLFKTDRPLARSLEESTDHG